MQEPDFSKLSKKKLRKVLKHKKYIERIGLLKFVLALFTTIGTIILTAFIRPDALTYVLPLSSLPAVGLGIDKVLSRRNNG